MSWKKPYESIKYAMQGFQEVWRQELNFRIEIYIVSLVIILGIYFSISFIEWIILIYASIMVLFAEIINTAIERVTDIQANKHKIYLAKKAKDIAASAVLLMCLQAVILGSVIFGQKIF